MNERARAPTIGSTGRLSLGNRVCAETPFWDGLTCLVYASYAGPEQSEIFQPVRWSDMKWQSKPGLLARGWKGSIHMVVLDMQENMQLNARHSRCRAGHCENYPLDKTGLCNYHAKKEQGLFGHSRSYRPDMNRRKGRYNSHNMTYTHPTLF